MSPVHAGTLNQHSRPPVIDTRVVWQGAINVFREYHIDYRDIERDSLYVKRDFHPDTYPTGALTLHHCNASGHPVTISGSYLIEDIAAHKDTTNTVIRCDYDK